MDIFCHQLPKIELHAHINSSISQKTFQELLLKKNLDKSRHVFVECLVLHGNNSNFDNLSNCFNVFKHIHEITNNVDAIYKITYDVIHEFYEDNVKYLELRTTPRAEVSTGMTTHSYVDTVLAAIKECRAENLDIDVRLLLSIDRKTTVDIAQQTVNIAAELMESSNGIILGVDFSGNPEINDARDFIPVLKDARSRGLKLAVHIAEVKNPSESHELVMSEPDRIGHGTFLHPPVGGLQETVDLVKKRNIPIECCFSSNLKSVTVPSAEEHHFGFWYKQMHPVIIATDGKGIFRTSLTEEYLLASKAFNLTKENLWELSQKSIDYIFADETTKNRLKLKWEKMKHHSIC